MSFIIHRRRGIDLTKVATVTMVQRCHDNIVGPNYNKLSEIRQVAMSTGQSAVSTQPLPCFKQVTEIHMAVKVVNVYVIFQG